MHQKNILTLLVILSLSQVALQWETYATKSLFLAAQKGANLVRESVGAANMIELPTDYENATIPYAQALNCTKNHFWYGEDNEYSYFEFTNPSVSSNWGDIRGMYKSMFEELMTLQDDYDYENRNCTTATENQCKAYLLATWWNVTSVMCAETPCYDFLLDEYWTQLDCYYNNPPKDLIFNADPWNLGDPCSECEAPNARCNHGMCSAVRFFETTNVQDHELWCINLEIEDRMNLCEDEPGIYMQTCPYTCDNEYDYYCQNGHGLPWYDCDTAKASYMCLFEDEETLAKCPWTCKWENGCVTPGYYDWSQTPYAEKGLTQARSTLERLANGSMKATYNTTLQKIARRIAMTCQASTDVNEYRTDNLGFDYLEETRYGPYSSYFYSPRAAMHAMIDAGYEHYNYENNSCNGTFCREYTIAMSKNVTEFGCSQIECAEDEWYMYCVWHGGVDYITFGSQTFDLLNQNYTEDPRPTCGDCPASHPYCESGLCAKEEPIFPYTTGNCTDFDENCPDWADAGLCRSFGGWYPQMCPHSCNTCQNDYPVYRTNNCEHLYPEDDTRYYDCAMIDTGYCSTTFYSYVCPYMCDVLYCD